MFHRVVFPLIVLFWITMNVLLWRAEFGSGRETGAAVSADVVWRKILTAPDDSTMEISWKGRKLGYCTWAANVGEARATGKVFSEDQTPEGMVRQLADYTIDFGGNFLLPESNGRVRFNLRLKFATNHLWQEMALRVASRHGVWELRTAAAEQTLRLTHEDNRGKWSNQFTYDDLRDPRKLAGEFGGPLASALLEQAPGFSRALDLSPGLAWEAHNDWLQIGHSQVRVYRLRARLLDKYEAVVIVSRVGELMRAELPGGIRLVNEALTTL